MDLIIAAPDEATRALLRERLIASDLLGGHRLGVAQRPAELAEQLAAEPERIAATLIVTAQGLAESEQFMRLGLAGGAPVLIFPMPVRAAAGTGVRRLSAREREVLSLVAAGVSNKGIARALHVSPNTVKFHLAALFTKLAVNTRAEAIAAAARLGELSL